MVAVRRISQCNSSSLLPYIPAIEPYTNEVLTLTSQPPDGMVPASEEGKPTVDSKDNEALQEKIDEPIRVIPAAVAKRSGLEVLEEAASLCSKSPVDENSDKAEASPLPNDEVIFLSTSPRISAHKEKASKPKTKMAREEVPRASQKSLAEYSRKVKVPHGDPWNCSKCGNENLGFKSRCGICQGWKGGQRDKFSRKPSPEKKEKKPKFKLSEQAKKMLPNRMHVNHVLLKKRDGMKVVKAKPLPTKKRRISDDSVSSVVPPTFNIFQKGGVVKNCTAVDEKEESLETKEQETELGDGEEVAVASERTLARRESDHMAADVLLGLMGVGSGPSSL